MIGDTIERAVAWMETRPRLVVGSCALGLVALIGAARTSDDAADSRAHVLHGRPPPPYIVCPHCGERFNLGDSHDFDESGIEQYIQRGRHNWLDAAPR